MPMAEPARGRSRNRAFVLSSLGTVATKFVLVLLKLAAGVLTARLLGPAGRGVFFMSVQTSGLATTAGASSIGEGLIYSLGQRRIGRQHVFAAAVLFSAVFSALILLALWLLLPVLTANVLSELPPAAVRLLYILVPAMVVEYVSFSALKGLKLFKTVNWLTLASRTNVLACLGFAVLVFPVSVETAIAGYAAGLWLNAIVFLIFLFKASGGFCLAPAREAWSAVKYGASVHIGTLMTEVEYRFDVFILLYFANAATVGIYSLGVSFAQMLWYVSNSINTVLFPYLSETDSEDRDRFAAAVLRHTLYINAAVLLLLTAIGYNFIVLLYGARFSEAYYVFLILVPGLLCDTASRTISAWLKGSGRPLVLSRISAAALVANLALNMLLVPSFGMYGAAVSSVVTYSARSALLIMIFCRQTSLPAAKLLLPTAGDRAGLLSACRGLRSKAAMRFGAVSGGRGR